MQIDTTIQSTIDKEKIQVAQFKLYDYLIDTISNPEGAVSASFAFSILAKNYLSGKIGYYPKLSMDKLDNLSIYLSKRYLGNELVTLTLQAYNTNKSFYSKLKKQKWEPPH